MADKKPEPKPEPKKPAVKQEEPEEKENETVTKEDGTVVEQLPGGGTRETAPDRPSRRYQEGHE